MKHQNIVNQLRSRIEITCREQEETIQAAIALLEEQHEKIEVLTYHLKWINAQEDKK